MKKVTEVRKELDNTTNRLTELNEMRERLNNNLQTLQSGFIDGKTSLDEVQTEQGRLTTLNASIATLETKQRDLQTIFNKAADDETRWVLLESAKASAIEAETMLNQYMELRTEFDGIISKFAENLLDKIRNFRNRRSEFLNITEQIESGSTGEPTMERNSLISKIDDELTAIGVSGETLNLTRTNYLNYLPLKFGEPIATIERIVGSERQKKEQAERRAERQAERFSTDEKLNSANV